MHKVYIYTLQRFLSAQLVSTRNAFIYDVMYFVA